MPIRCPLKAVGVSRDGVTVYPTIGQPFDFTPKEVADINDLTKASGIVYLRKPVNEGSDPAPKADVALTDMTVAQLKEAAAERNVDLGEATRKDQILAVLEAAAATTDDDL